MLGTSAADVRLDPVNLPKQFDELRGERRFGALVQIDKAAAQVGKTEGELDRPRLTSGICEVFVGSIAINLQHAFIAAQLLSDLKPAP